MKSCTKHKFEIRLGVACCGARLVSCMCISLPQSILQTETSGKKNQHDTFLYYFFPCSTYKEYHTTKRYNVWLRTIYLVGYIYGYFAKVFDFVFLFQSNVWIQRLFLDLQQRLFDFHKMTFCSCILKLESFFSLCMFLISLMFEEYFLMFFWVR